MKKDAVENIHKNIGPDLQSEWEEALGYPVSQADYEEIRDNLTAFFNLLTDWDIQNKSKFVGSDDSVSTPDMEVETP